MSRKKKPVDVIINQRNKSAFLFSFFILLYLLEGRVFHLNIALLFMHVVLCNFLLKLMHFLMIISMNNECN